MSRALFYVMFSVFASFVPAMVIGVLVSVIDDHAGTATAIAIFGWLLTNLLIRRRK